MNNSMNVHAKVLHCAGDSRASLPYLRASVWLGRGGFGRFLRWRHSATRSAIARHLVCRKALKPKRTRMVSVLRISCSFCMQIRTGFC